MSMVDLKDFIADSIQNATAYEKTNTNAITAFLIDNNWFDISPAIINQKVKLDESQCEILRKPLETFLSQPQSCEYLLEKLHDRFSATADLWKTFAEEEKLPENVQMYVLDFLLYRLEKEEPFYNNKEIKELLKIATDDMTKTHGDLLTFFIAWVRSKTTTSYNLDFTMEKRYTLGEKNKAYSMDEYLALCYRLFNEEYIWENDMYACAATSKNYTDTWLFLSIHFICSLRYTDLKCIYHPKLPYTPQETLDRVRNGTFTANDARKVLLSITKRLCLLPLTPNKTEEKSGIGSIKLVFPASCELHFGILFALAEAHRQIDGTANTPIIRKVSTYEEITRYMGDDIGELFLESNFRARSATKSYLQSIYMMADDILQENNPGPSVKGYLLAALARSHKETYGEFANTTFEYLKDAKFSGLTPEFVAFELFERGVLSSIASSLLKIITNNNYSNLTVQQQTSLVKTLNLMPSEVEAIVSICDAGRKRAEAVIKEVLSSDIDILSALHEIGSGQAFSKQPDSLCLLSATKKLCPYATARQCIGCEYEISTKSTLFLLIAEYKRMFNLYKTVSEEHERNKYKQMAVNVVIPKINEMLNCIKQSYGDETYRQYENYVKENVV